MLHKVAPLLLLVTLLFTHPCLGQRDDATFVDLQYAIKFETNDINVEFVLLGIYGDPSGTYADAILRFKNPQTGEWIEFNVSGARYSSNGFIGNFELILQEGIENEEVLFISDLLNHKGGRIYIWKRRCKCMPPEFAL